MGRCCNFHVAKAGLDVWKCLGSLCARASRAGPQATATDEVKEWQPEEGAIHQQNDSFEKTEKIQKQQAIEHEDPHRFGWAW